MAIRAYISGALQAAKDLTVARAKYEAAGAAIQQLGFEAYLPHRETDPQLNSNAPPSEVFQRDIEQLLKCDVVIAFLDEPSLGVGAEIATALSRGIKVIALLEEHSSTSRFVEGYLHSAEVPISGYEGISDLRASLAMRLSAGLT